MDRYITKHKLDPLSNEIVHPHNRKKTKTPADNTTPHDQTENTQVPLDPPHEEVCNISKTSEQLKPAEVKTKNQYVFSQKWLELKEFKDWLTTETVKSTLIAKCKYCQAILQNHKPHLIRHSETAKHKSLVKTIKNTQTITPLFQTPEDKMAKRGELKIAATLATNNLPFLLSETLVSLIADVCPDSKIAQKMKMSRTKATAVVTQILGPCLQNELNDHLRQPGNFFSLIMDETTDIGTKKQCAITVIYSDRDFKIRTQFFDLFEMPSGTADDLFNGLIQSLHAKNIPLENFVGFSSDTTNVMVGEHNSVFSKLKEKLPHIVCVRCTCHMVHLAASKACLKLPKSVEDLLRNIGAHFSRSHNRQQKLAEMQAFYKTEMHKILMPAATRWLSLKACVDRTLEQYCALEAYFTAEIVDDPSRVTESIIISLRNQFNKVYLEFMSYVLELLNDINISFQSESPLLYKLKPSIENLLRTIASNYMELQQVKNKAPFEIEHKNPRLFLALEKVYLGVLAETSLQEFKESVTPPDEDDLKRFRLDCLNFYVEVISEIKKRFVFTDPLFEIISIVDPINVQDNIELQKISGILRRFPFLMTYLNEGALVKDWREYCLLDIANLENISITMPAADYWTKIFQLKDIAGSTRFKNLKRVIGLLLVLPFSNATVERVFSKLKLLKTENRNRLSTETIAALMTTSSSIKQAGGIQNFEPTASMMRKKIDY